MRGPRGLIRGVVYPLGVVGFRVYGLVGSDVRIAEKVARGDDDVTEGRDIVNGPQVVLRSLGVVRRFAKGKRRRTRRGAKGRSLRCHFLLPFSVLTHAEYVCFTKGSQSFGGLLGREKERRRSVRECVVRPMGNQLTYTIFWSCSLRWRYFS